jgi:hypothetical protein
MTIERKRVLTILNGCPEGATEYNMLTRLGVHRSTIRELINSRLVTLYDASVRANGFGPRIEITRLRITPAGKLALIAMQKRGGQ